MRCQIHEDRATTHLHFLAEREREVLHTPAVSQIRVVTPHELFTLAIGQLSSHIDEQVEAMISMCRAQVLEQTFSMF